MNKPIKIDGMFLKGVYLFITRSGLRLLMVVVVIMMVDLVVGFNILIAM